MSVSETIAKFTETTGGKAVVGAVVVIALGLVIFEVSHVSMGGESRTVPAAQAVSDAQLQIDAINKMTNLTPEQKKAMIAHEQGNIGIAKGGPPAAGGPPAGGPPPSGQ